VRHRHRDEDSETSYDSDDSRERKSRKRSRSHHKVSRRKKNKGSDRSSRGNAKSGDEMAESVEFKKNKMDALKHAQVPTPEDNAAPLVGPLPLPQPRVDVQVNYGGALRPGEGDAMAQFVQQGKRIPRRGEVGLSADEIQRFEDAGYVMSGSRHSRINVVRLRKENQVYSAEEKRALATFNYEQRAMRESKVREDLRRLVDRTLGNLAGTEHDPFADK
jgi:hypothetical protein